MFIFFAFFFQLPIYFIIFLSVVLGRLHVKTSKCVRGFLLVNTYIFVLQVTYAFLHVKREIYPVPVLLFGFFLKLIFYVAISGTTSTCPTCGFLLSSICLPSSTHLSPSTKLCLSSSASGVMSSMVQVFNI